MTQGLQPPNVKAIRDSIRAAEHSGNHTPNTCAQEYPEGPKSAELMRENLCAPQVRAPESRQLRDPAP